MVIRTKVVVRMVSERRFANKRGGAGGHLLVLYGVAWRGGGFGLCRGLITGISWLKLEGTGYY